MLLVCARHLSADIAEELNASGRAWKQITEASEAIDLVPADGWQACLAVISSTDDATDLTGPLHAAGVGPLIAMLDSVPHDLAALDAFADVVVLPAHRDEIVMRIERLIHQSSHDVDELRHGPVHIDTTSYQVFLKDRCLDLTYMEYELLKHFVVHAGEVLSREDLLRHVWGYEYFGGGRTVDVHVRRLRAKFGQEHSHLISTLRSVGYRFSERTDSE